MATVNSIYIMFNFSCNNGDFACYDEKFDPADSSLKPFIEDRRDELLDGLNFNSEDKWEFDDWGVDTFDGDYMDPDDFIDIDKYGEYCENVEKFGEAFHLRYEDIGEHDFEDSYEGCWKSAEDFVQNLVEVDIPPFVYIDWERTVHDVMMDYSEYDSSEGTHIFRDS